jgi:hypothetical protein
MARCSHDLLLAITSHLQTSLQTIRIVRPTLPCYWTPVSLPGQGTASVSVRSPPVLQQAAAMLSGTSLYPTEGSRTRVHSFPQ